MMASFRRSNYPTIPSDVLYNILLNLPPKTLVRFRYVCKEWYYLINEPQFIQLHLDKSLDHHPRALVYTNNNSLYVIHDIDIDIDSDPRSRALARFNWHDNINLSEQEDVCFVGSSNGLVCLNISGGNSYIICNPVTREFKLVPYPAKILSCANIWWRFEYSWFGLHSFGYDTQHDDYKVVYVAKKLNQDRETWVYSLKKDSWRNANSHGFYALICYPPLVLAFGHGMVHCIIRGFDYQARIARFNLSSEQWEDDYDLVCPIDPISMSIYDIHLAFLDGQLCLFTTKLAGLAENFIVDIWIMKEYGVNESWTKLLDLIIPSHIGRPIGYSRTRPEVLWFHSSQGSIFCYDTKHKIGRKEFKFSNVKEYPNLQVPVYVCAPSLVPIPGSSHMRGQTHQLSG